MWRESCNEVVDVFGRQQEEHNANAKLSDVQANWDDGPESELNFLINIYSYFVLSPKARYPISA